MPSATAAFATFWPIAPRPITPSFLPWISVPAKAFFAFSADLLIAASAAFAFTHSMPPTMSRLARSMAAITSSFTPFALAPGVLNTTMPFFAYSAWGMLFTPAPARATARRFAPGTISSILALRTNTASAAAKSSVRAYLSSRLFSPTAAMGFRQVYL